MIPESSIEKALDFYRDNAERLGELSGRCKALEHERKTVRGKQFLKASGTVAEREAIAESSAEYRAITEDIENVWADKVTLETQLKAAELRIEVWRSQYSKQGKGHV